MRILYLSDNSSDHNRRFLEALSFAGHEVYFLDVTAAHLREDWLPAGAQWIRPQPPLPPLASPRHYQAFLPQFQRILQDVKPDLVHAGPVQTCGYLAALSDFHPFLVMSWGSDLLLDAYRNREWQQATEVALLRADALFCDCNSVRRAALQYASIPDSRIVQLPWGIKRDSFSPVGGLPPQHQIALDAGTIPVLCTRSWEPLYDMPVVLEAFCRACDKNKNLRLLLLGAGSEANHLRDFIAQHELQAVVLMPGVIPRAQVPAWFRAARIYLSCARTDGTSVSLLEAMATGLPAIVTDIPSNREWVTEDENGWLAQTGSAEQFADKLLRAASLSSSEREAISRRNRSIISQRADWDRNFPQLLDMYESLAGREVETAP